MATTWFTYNGKGLMKGAYGLGSGSPTPPPTPTIPPYTVRVRFSDRTFVPTVDILGMRTDVAWNVVDAGDGIWDCVCTRDNFPWVGPGKNWNNLFDGTFTEAKIGTGNSVEIIGCELQDVTQTEAMFRGCNLVTSVGALYDGGDITTAMNMFSGCTQLGAIPQCDWSSCQYFNGMFYNCSNLRTAGVIDASSALQLTRMFSFCTSLTSCPVNSSTTASVTSFEGMFAECHNLGEVPLLDLTSATTVRESFKNTYNVTHGSLALYQRASVAPGIIAGGNTAHYRTFYRCGRDSSSGAAELAQIPSDWK